MANTNHQEQTFLTYDQKVKLTWVEDLIKEAAAYETIGMIEYNRMMAGDWANGEQLKAASEKFTAARARHLTLVNTYERLFCEYLKGWKASN